MAPSNEPSTGPPPSTLAVPSTVPAPRQLQIATQILVAVALLAAVHYGLLASLLAGMLVYELVHVLAPGHENRFVHRRTGKIIVVTMLAGLVIAAIGATILGVVSLLASGPENLSLLMQKMAEVIETARSRFPPWVLSSFPDEPEELKTAAAAWLRDHAGQLSSTGQNLWRGLIHVLFGMVIGGMVAVSREAGDIERGPLAEALGERARLLGAAFRSVAFAQVRIAALNAGLTAVYLMAVVPAMGIHVPFAKTMIAVTLITGLLPVVGNLIANVVITLVSLSVSPVLALTSLVFLIVIHKLEYFVNAQVMGGRIQARAWELLIAMLIMDAIFGVVGIVAAPIYYAYAKKELSTHNLI